MLNIYFGLVVFILIAAYLFRGDERRNTFLFLAFFALFFVMGFRHAAVVGVDSTTSYLSSFKKMDSYSFVMENNFAFYLWMKLIYTITNGNYHLYCIITSAFVMFAYYYVVKKYSKKPLISILWFMGMLFYTFMFSALKQTYAMAILCFAFDAIMKKNPIRFILLVSFAACFHLPALIFLPAYWIAKMNIGRAYFLLLGLVLVVVFVFRSQILNWMMSGYKGEEATFASTDASFFGVKVSIMLIIAVIAFVLRMPDKEDRLYSVLLMFIGVSIVLQTFSGYSNIFERLADYYFVFSILFISMPFENQGEYKTLVAEESLPTINVWATVIVSVFCIWRFLSTVNNVASQLLPYKFCWQPL